MKDYLGDPAFADDTWITSTPEAEGMDSAVLRAGLAHIQSRDLAVHSLLVVRHGRLVLEQHGVEEDRQWTPADAHAMYSTTKTLTSMLIGMAIADGVIESVRARAAGYFEDDEIQERTPAKDLITVEDLLTMRSGLEYEEGLTDNSSAIAGKCAARAILSRRMVAEPGVRWNYSTADSQVLAEILRRATGRTPLDYARERLLGPLGITGLQWNADGGGTHLGGTGLFLRPRDLARFGLMLLRGGRWDGRQLVPAAWLEIATRRQVIATSGYTPGEAYGYHCWIPKFGGFSTHGYMGQHLFVLPDRDVLAVFTGALVPPERADATLDDFVSEFVLSAVRGA